MGVGLREEVGVGVGLGVDVGVGEGVGAGVDVGEGVGVGVGGVCVGVKVAMHPVYQLVDVAVVPELYEPVVDAMFSRYATEQAAL